MKYILDSCLLKKVQTFLTPSTKYLTKQYIDSLNLSWFILWTNKSNSTKIHTQRLKIEAFECYTIHSKTIWKKHCLHTVVLRVFKMQIKNKIITTLCVFWHRLERRWTCCRCSVFCRQHLPIICSFKIRWWKRGLPHTIFGLFSYKLFRSLTPLFYFCHGAPPSFLLFGRSISILID